MRILIVSATEFEIFPLLKKFSVKKSSGNLRVCRFRKHQIDFLITGIGMTATAFWLGKTLGNKYDLAINLGLAGSFRKNIPPGAVVNVEKDCFADLGAEDGEKFLTLKEMGLEKARSRKPEARSHTVKRTVHGLPKVNGITVNTVHGNEAGIRRIIKKFNPDVESMEGAAFFFACSHEKIPCIQIRGISNYAERRNKKNWKIELAVKNLCGTMEDFLQHL